MGMWPKGDFFNYEDLWSPVWDSRQKAEGIQSHSTETCCVCPVQVPSACHPVSKKERVRNDWTTSQERWTFLKLDPWGRRNSHPNEGDTKRQTEWDCHRFSNELRQNLRAFFYPRNNSTPGNCWHKQFTNKLSHPHDVTLNTNAAHDIHCFLFWFSAARAL